MLIFGEEEAAAVDPPTEGRNENGLWPMLDDVLVDGEEQ
jgi:hypothetical protein